MIIVRTNRVSTLDTLLLWTLEHYSYKEEDKSKKMLLLTSHGGYIQYKYIMKKNELGCQYY